MVSIVFAEGLFSGERSGFVEDADFYGSFLFKLSKGKFFALVEFCDISV